MTENNQFITLFVEDKDGNYTSNQKSIIYGGSCTNPSNEALSKANYFIALDEKGFLDRAQFVPLHNYYPILDHGVPSNISEFKNFIIYLKLLLSKGLILHIGCTAGMGRTGLVMAALVQECQPKRLESLGISAIDYVRNLYSTNAIESVEQEQFLIDNFSVKKPLLTEN